MHLDLERIVERINEYTFGFRGAHHDDQLYLSEFVAFKAKELLFNIDLDVEARNAVVVQAAKLQNCSSEEAAELRATREIRFLRAAMATMPFEGYLPSVRAIKERPEGDILGDREPGEDPVLLEHEDPPGVRLGDLDTVDAHVARGRPLEPPHDVQQGRVPEERACGQSRTRRR